MLYLDYARDAGAWVPNKDGGRENLEAVELLKETNGTAYKRVGGIVTIAEESTTWPGVTKPTNEGGLGFGFKWNMGWMNDSLKYLGEEPIYRKYHHGKLTFSLMYAFDENFVLPISHDEVVHGKGSLLRKSRGSREEQVATLRAFLAYLWCHPGKQLLFMGCEFGQESEWSEGRSLDWWLLEQPLHYRVHNLVKDLNGIYRSHRALWELDADRSGFEWLEADDAAHNTFSWLRFGKGDRATDAPVVACVMNFSGETQQSYRIGLPRGGQVDGRPRHRRLPPRRPEQRRSRRRGPGGELARPAVCRRPHRAAPVDRVARPRRRATGARDRCDVRRRRTCRHEHERRPVMSHPRAGQPAQAEDLVDVDALIGAYYDRHPDVDDPDQQVAFGTSGHRGSSLRTAFNEDHILATTQAIVDYRVSQGFDGPLFIGRDTHGLSEPAWRSALEVLVANGVRVLVDDRDGFTPTPAVSHAILRANRGKGAPAQRDSPTASSSRRRTTRRPTAASSTTRRTAARPTPTRRPSSRPAPTSSSAAGCKDVKRVAFDKARGGGRLVRLPGHLRRRPAPRRRPRPHPRGRACASAPTRSAAPRSPTGARSASGTDSTSPSSTRASTRSGRS